MGRLFGNRRKQTEAEIPTVWNQILQDSTFEWTTHSALKECWHLHSTLLCAQNKQVYIVFFPFLFFAIICSQTFPLWGYNIDLKPSNLKVEQVVWVFFSASSLFTRWVTKPAGLLTSFLHFSLFAKVKKQIIWTFCLNVFVPFTSFKLQHRGQNKCIF